MRQRALRSFRSGSGTSSTDLGETARRLRNMSAKARRLAVSATLSADDVVAFNQFAAQLDRDAARLEAQLAPPPPGLVLPPVSATQHQVVQQQMQQQQSTEMPARPQVPKQED